jgi:tRNA-2-methylthio-N6-dimethylallyladenosine synthase
VHFPSPRPLRVGSYAEVLVTEAAPHHLKGDLVAVTAAARHRTRIPVAAG